ncbi:unnamed protein product [Phaeothamnion confervicola]
MAQSFAFALAVALALASYATGFISPSIAFATRTGATLQMGLMDGFKKAFENEDYKDRSTTPGLKNGPARVEVIVNGKKISAVAGQRLPDVCKAAGAKVEYNCQKGECGTCESLVDGRKVRICKAIVPYNKPSISITTKKY